MDLCAIISDDGAVIVMCSSLLDGVSADVKNYLRTETRLDNGHVFDGY